MLNRRSRKARRRGEPARKGETECGHGAQICVERAQSVRNRYLGSGKSESLQHHCKGCARCRTQSRLQEAALSDRSLTDFVLESEPEAAHDPARARRHCHEPERRRGSRRTRCMPGSAAAKGRAPRAVAGSIEAECRSTFVFRLPAGSADATGFARIGSAALQPLPDLQAYQASSVRRTLRRWRRRAASIPAMPMPNKAMLPGSGTVVPTGASLIRNTRLAGKPQHSLYLRSKA